MRGEMDASLLAAQAQWESRLELGQAAMDEGRQGEALAAFSEAVRVSSGFHPLYHFLESGLNSELAILLLKAGRFGEALLCFERALFLDHSNQTAIAGIEAAGMENSTPPPPYAFTRLTQGLLKGEIHALREDARAGGDALSLYRQAIERCEETHQAYHKLAALPWLARARCFMAQGERELARNDARRGLDLDPAHPGLLGISAIRV